MMKKVWVFVMALFFAIGASAQDEQGNANSNKTVTPSMWLGGEITFGSMSNLDLTIGPNWGLMIGERIGVGATLTYSTGNRAFLWGFDPYFRYYLPVSDPFSFFGDIFLGIGGGDNNTNIDGGYYNTFDFGARIGLQYWFVPSWSLAASTNILTYNSTNNEGEFGAGVSFNSLSFSLFFHF